MKIIKYTGKKNIKHIMKRIKYTPMYRIEIYNVRGKQVEYRA